MDISPHEDNPLDPPGDVFLVVLQTMDTVLEEIEHLQEEDEEG